jgi:hypothetical protein
VTRVPVVLGLGRRSGAGTVTAALHASECRRPPLIARGAGSWPADIAVCAGDDASLGRADAVRGAAVLLIVLVDDPTPPTRARQQELARRHGSVVVLPHVREWAGLSGVPAEAEALFARPPEQLPPALCAYTRGLRLAVAALLRTSVLTRPRPPALIWSPPTTLPTKPVLGLDDDAIEAEVLAAAANGTEPSAARARAATQPAAAAPAPSPSTAAALTHLRIRALHRPVMGPARVESAKAG